MTKIIKKITATAAAIIALGAFGLSASANETKTWSVTHINTPGAPSIVNYEEVEMVSARYVTYCAMAQTMTDLASREVTITSNTHSMSRTIRINTPNKEQEWTLLYTGDFDNKVVYKVTGSTTDREIFRASGYITRN